MESFSSFDLCKKLDIKRPTLQDWLSRGFIIPDVQATGRGTKNVFSRTNLYQIELFRVLVARGFNRMESAKWAQFMADHMITRSSAKLDLDELYLVVGVKDDGSSIGAFAEVKNFNQLGLYFEEELSAFGELHFVQVSKIIQRVNRLFLL